MPVHVVSFFTVRGWGEGSGLCVFHRIKRGGRNIPVVFTYLKRVGIGSVVLHPSSLSIFTVRAKFACVSSLPEGASFPCLFSLLTERA